MMPGPRESGLMPSMPIYCQAEKRLEVGLAEAVEAEARDRVAAAGEAVRAAVVWRFMLRLWLRTQVPSSALMAALEELVLLQSQPVVVVEVAAALADFFCFITTAGPLQRTRQKRMAGRAELAALALPELAMAPEGQLAQAECF
jgi:hypothetical protein